MFFVTEVTDESLTTTAFNIEDGITIYLNPASDRLFVYLFIESNRSLKNVVVYSVNGQRINLQLSGNEVVSGYLTSGLYFIEMTTIDGEIVREKFVKK